MPSHPTPFLPKLICYAVPVVIEAIKEIGPPSEIKKVTAKGQQGPLMVTLVAQLAGILKEEITEKLFPSRDPVPDLLDDLRSIHGGEKYQTLVRKLEAARDGESQSHRLVSVAERKLLSRHFAQTGGKTAPHSWLTSKRTQSPLGGNLYWNPNAQNKGAFEKAKEEYESLVTQLDASQKTSLRLHQLVEDFRKRIEKSPAYVQAIQDLGKSQPERFRIGPNGALASSGLKIDFAQIWTSQTDVVHYLRNTDAAWWQALATYIDHKVDAAYRTPRILLREPKLRDMIYPQTPSSKGPTLDTATIDVIRKPSKYGALLRWHDEGKDRSGADVRQWRRRLRIEDEDAIEWIHTHGGTRHPLHPYRRWLWKKSQAVNFKLNQGYSEGRAVNELLWCLSRRDPKNYPFKGDFSRQYPEARWTKRKKKWGDRPPNYFTLKHIESDLNQAD